MPTDWSPLWLSMKVAALATAAAIPAGLGLAWLITSREFKGRRALEAAVWLPFLLPTTVTAYLLVVTFGQDTLLGRAWETLTGTALLFTVKAAVVAAFLQAAPTMAVGSMVVMRGLNPAWERAARSMGVSRWRTFTGVTLAVCRRALTCAAVVAFLRAYGDFGFSLMLAGSIPGRTQVVAVAVWEAAAKGEAAAARGLVVASALLTFVALWGLRRLWRVEAA